MNIPKFLLLSLFIMGLFFYSPVHAKSYKILYIEAQNKEPYRTARKSLIKTLDNFGYKQGENLAIVYYSIGNDKNKGINILKNELITKYDSVILSGTIATIAAKELTLNNNKYRKHNFFFLCVTDPVGIGVIDNFNSPPKANFSGVCYPVSVKKRFKFIQTVMPQVKNIGLIYADMPQSQSYKKWIENLLATDPKMKNIKVHFRPTPFIEGENGGLQMAKNAQKHIQELNPLVDVFICPNDSMGVQKHYSQMVYKYSKKPLVGLGEKDVMEKWGTTMSIFPRTDLAGEQCAKMIQRIFKGESIKSIIPEWPQGNGIAFDLSMIKKFNIDIPPAFLELAGENIAK